MTYAAKVIENEGGSLVDLNMGCPAKKIVGKLAGSALMRDPKHALKIMESVVNSTSLPVTLKIRLGWDEESMNADTIAKSAEDIGIQMITVHARTRNQFFKGKADWSMVKRVKDSVSIPIVVNGDVIDINSAKLAVNKSLADGIMIGRGAIGKPWLLRDISRSVYRIAPRVAGECILLSELVLLHFEKILSFYGSDLGLRMFRKHLVSYLKNSTLSRPFYKDLLTENSIKRLERKIRVTFLNNAKGV
jgi:nifR3 family TIM-barrel protein